MCKTTVVAQENDPDSLFSHYRALISLRKKYPTLRTGETEVLDTGTTGLFATLRTEGKEKLLIVVNLTDEVIREYVLPDAYSLKGIFG